jgi:serine/threonine protein kinase
MGGVSRSRTIEIRFHTQTKLSGSFTMETFTVKKTQKLVSSSGQQYPVGAVLGSGSFGEVYASGADKIVKVMKSNSAAVEQAMLDEIAIQTKLNEKEPGVCPRLYAFGKIASTGHYVIVMEKCEGTARDLFKSNPDPEIRLDYYEQVAKILQRLEPYKFNHRDLKSDNIMYKTDPTTGKRTFLLIDFGFSCLTVDGKTYAGTSYFPPTSLCFRRSRDLAQLVFESLYYTTGDVRTLAQLLLVFTYKGRTCDMSKGCLPDFSAKWAETYEFLNRSGVENPNTTPEGLLKAVETYRAEGLEKCKAGLVVHPVANQCVPVPPAPAPGALQVAKSPVAHVVNPAPGPATVAKTRRKKAAACPPGKVRNAATRRCVKKPAKAAPCPQGKVKNPATGRCMKKPCAPGQVRNPETGRCKKKT